jgi:hypothetical protein
MRELMVKLWLGAGKAKAEVWKSLNGSLSSDYTVVTLSLVTEEHDHCHLTMVNLGLLKSQECSPELERARRELGLRNAGASRCIATFHRLSVS